MRTASSLPDYWKSSSVFPFLRTLTDRLFLWISNLLSPFGKVLKASINSKLIKHLTSHGLLSIKAYCFCFSRSTVDGYCWKTLLKFTYERRSSSFWFYIMNTVDMVRHADILYMLKGYGVSGCFLDLIQSSLRNHIMNVDSNDHSSRSFTFNAGNSMRPILLSTFFLNSSTFLMSSVLDSVFMPKTHLFTPVLIASLIG